MRLWAAFCFSAEDKSFLLKTKAVIFFFSQVGIVTFVEGHFYGFHNHPSSDL